MGDVISGIGIGTAAAGSVRYRAPARCRSNPLWIAQGHYKFCMQVIASSTIISQQIKKNIISMSSCHRHKLAASSQQTVSLKLSVNALFAGVTNAKMSSLKCKIL